MSLERLCCRLPAYDCSARDQMKWQINAHLYRSLHETIENHIRYLHFQLNEGMVYEIRSRYVSNIRGDKKRINLQE